MTHKQTTRPHFHRRERIETARTRIDNRLWGLRHRVYSDPFGRDLVEIINASVFEGSSIFGAIYNWHMTLAPAGLIWFSDLCDIFLVVNIDLVANK